MVASLHNAHVYCLLLTTLLSSLSNDAEYIFWRKVGREVAEKKAVEGGTTTLDLIVLEGLTDPLFCSRWGMLSKFDGC